MLVGFVNLALGNMFSWSFIMNHLDLCETFDAVISEFLENRDHVLMISYICNTVLR